MQIVCPHCETAYQVAAAALEPVGRTVRCVRCKETWVAMPVAEREPAMAFVPHSGADMTWGNDADSNAEEPAHDAGPPHIDSPPLAAEMSSGEEEFASEESSHDAVSNEAIEHLAPRFGTRKARTQIFQTAFSSALQRLHIPLPRFLSGMGLSGAIGCMAALCLALIFWRVEIVRMVPQTDTAFRAAGLGVNLRGLEFRSVRLTNEGTSAAPVIVIEGDIVNVQRKAVEVPRLRFAVQDGNGAEIYTWNATVDQAYLNVNEKAWFRTRLAAPPPESREVAVRFFHKRDIAGAN